jgi:two-component system sensor histidine kinase DegS
VAAPESLPVPLLEIAERARREVDLLSREIGEIELLVQQARSEASRHEAKTSQAVDKLKSSAGYNAGSEAAEQTEQLLAMARRAAIMEAQVDMLDGKVKILTRYHDSLRNLSAELDRASMGGAMPQHTPDKLDTDTPLPPAVSRLVLAAQEDLRRDIARAMHDGPAQSLTNIVLQAQIVERLLDRNPSQAKSEIGQLVGMVQHTLEATKTFIFDVRPMVLDDLGLVPTLRRVARDRGRRSQVPIEFESYGQDRRLPMDVESALFRIIDEAVTGYLSCHPILVSIKFEWGDERVEARVAAKGDAGAEGMEAEDAEGADRGRGGPPDMDVPVALRAMIDEKRAEAAAARSSRAEALAMPANTWREIQQRASTIGVRAELSEDGREVILLLTNA